MFFSEVFDLLLIVVSNCLFLGVDVLLESINLLFIGLPFSHAHLFDPLSLSMELFGPVFSFFRVLRAESSDFCFMFLL